MDEQQRSEPREIIPIRARPITEGPVRIDGHLPPIVAKTVNICVNCVQGAGRSVSGPMRRRYDRHYHPRHRHGGKHFIADVALVFAVLALVGVNGYLFTVQTRTLPSKIRLTWTAPVAVRNGETVAWDLAYQYFGDDALDRATVTFQPPPEITIFDVTPGVYDTRTHELFFSSVVAPGASGTIHVTGSILAADGSAVTLPATFHGTGSDRSERQRTEVVVPVRGVAIAFTVEAPPLVPAHGGALVDLRYRSEAAIPISHLILHGEFTGRSFRMGNVVFPDETIDMLTPGSTGVWRVPLATDAAGSYPLTVAVRRVLSNGDVALLGVITSTVAVRDAGIAMAVHRFDVSDVVLLSDHPPVVHLGDRFGVTVTYTRTRTEGSSSGASLPASAAEEVRLTANVLGRTVIIPRDHGTFLPGGVVRWPFTAEAGGSSGTVSVEVRVPVTMEPEAFSVDHELRYSFTPEIILAVDSDHQPTAWIAHGDPLVLSLAGEFRLAAIARYYTPEGDQIGRGPLPPRVGATTRYWVTWDAQSLFREAHDVVVRATLGDGVEWTGHLAATEGPSPQFDPARRTVTWRVGSLFPTIGAERPVATASFELAFSPNSSHVGHVGTLLTESVVTGVDAVGVSDTATAPPVTTALAFDQRARGKGIVQAEE